MAARIKGCAWLAVSCSLLSAPQAFAECGTPKREKACVLANHDGPIIVATVLRPAAEPGVLPGQPGFEWHVRVDRTFRGSVKRNVVIFVTHGDLFSSGRLTIGAQYLFYLSPMLPDGSDGLSASIGCGSSTALELVEKSELTFLARLRSRANDGHIFGEVSRYPPGREPPVLFGGVRVTATDGKRSYSAVTKADGTYDIGGLPAGSYRVSAALAGAQDEGTDDAPIVIQPHGCAEVDIEVAPPRTAMPVPFVHRNRSR